MNKSRLISIYSWMLLIGITLTVLPLELVQEEGVWTEVSTKEGEEQKKGEENENEVEDGDKFSDDSLAFRLKANRSDANSHWTFLDQFNWVNPTTEIFIPPPEGWV